MMILYEVELDSTRYKKEKHFTILEPLLNMNIEYTLSDLYPKGGHPNIISSSLLGKCSLIDTGKQRNYSGEVQCFRIAFLNNESSGIGSDYLQEINGLSALRIIDVYPPEDIPICKGIEFLTPVCLKYNGEAFLFPMPDVWLPRAVERLHQLGICSLSEQQIKQFVKFVCPIEYVLRTITSHGHTGFIGYCDFSGIDIPDDDKMVLYQLLYTLPFIGLGEGTCIGLGQCRMK